jgi:hypothetical protein
MKRTACSGCGYDDLKMFLDLGYSPIADAYTDQPWQSIESYPLQVAVCTGCHLAQLLEVVDQKTLFGTGYSFYSSASPPLSAYHERYAREVIYDFNDLHSLVVEIGCNDGDMLRHFDPQRAVGVDPSGGPVEKAREHGLNVLNLPFTTSVAERIRDEQGPAGVVIANHVLAHVESVSEVLHGVSELLARRGVAYVEVQYLPDLLTNNAFDLVYHEHRNFFSLTSLLTAAKQWGLAPLDAQLTDRQGGSLRVKLGHESWAAPKPSVSNILAREEWLRSPDAYGGVQGRVERIRTRLRDVIFDERARKRTVALYGAPAKATTLLHFCDLDSDQLVFALDSTLAKQGRFVPGTGIEILAPDYEDAGSADTFLVASWNYASTIVRTHEETYGRRRWIMPIPAPTVL